MDDKVELVPVKPRPETLSEETRNACADMISEERKQRLEKEMRMRSTRVVKSQIILTTLIAYSGCAAAILRRKFCMFTWYSSQVPYGFHLN